MKNPFMTCKKCTELIAIQTASFAKMRRADKKMHEEMAYGIRSSFRELRKKLATINVLGFKLSYSSRKIMFAIDLRPLFFALERGMDSELAIDAIAEECKHKAKDMLEEQLDHE